MQIKTLSDNALVAYYLNLQRKHSKQLSLIGLPDWEPAEEQQTDKESNMALDEIINRNLEDKIV